MDYQFIVGNKYRRKDVYRIIGIPTDTKGGNWDTGYNKYKDDWFIFCNIGQPGRTGHDYKNEFIGSDLAWYGKTFAKLSHPSIQSMLSANGYVYIFTRNDNKGPFVFAGVGRAKSTFDSVPVKIIWELNRHYLARPVTLAEEVFEPHKYFEGATKKIAVNVYERNPEARIKCIEHYGASCVICGFDFAERYGSIGEGYIHVHHLKPLSEIAKEYSLDPIEDLRPVCPNCHAMIHRKSPPYTIAELQHLIHSVDKIKSYQNN